MSDMDRLEQIKNIHRMQSDELCNYDGEDIEWLINELEALRKTHGELQRKCEELQEPIPGNSMGDSPTCAVCGSPL